MFEWLVNLPFVEFYRLERICQLTHENDSNSLRNAKQLILGFLSS